MPRPVIPPDRGCSLVLEHSEGVLEVPQLSEMIQTLIGLLQQGTDVGGPCQVLGDVDAKAFEAFHPLQL